MKELGFQAAELQAWCLQEGVCFRILAKAPSLQNSPGDPGLRVIPKCILHWEGLLAPEVEWSQWLDWPRAGYGRLGAAWRLLSTQPCAAIIHAK